MFSETARKRRTDSRLTDTSKISSQDMNSILEKLKLWQSHESTKKNYLGIWRQFNNFVIRLDKKLKTWEQCLSLYGAFLFEQGIQSSTLRCYVSAVKHVVTVDGYQWDDELISLNDLIRACKIKNDSIRPMLPIHINFLEILLFEVKRLWSKSLYLEYLYKTLFLLAYYGLMRISEVVGIHALKAKDVHMASNKNKILLVLYSSKTHSKESLPQKIKISNKYDETGGKQPNERFFCPFAYTRKYLKLRGDYVSPNENFFVFLDGSKVTTSQVRVVLRKMLEAVNLDTKVYSFQGIRAGRAVDLRKLGYSVDRIKELGHWKSNAVYRYLKQ